MSPLYHNSIKEVFLGGNISKEEFESERASANKIPDADIMWGLLNKKLNKHMLESDCSGMKLIYLDMANFLRVEGRSFLHILKALQKCNLMTYKEAGLKNVRILTARDNLCKTCSQLEGKVLTIDKALETMPLPPRECEFSISGCRKGWCRCCYVAEGR